MKQFLFAIALAATLVSCDSTKPISQEKYQKSLVKYTDKISEAELKKQLYIIAAPDMEGRNAGTEGEIKAGNYISNYYKIFIPVCLLIFSVSWFFGEEILALFFGSNYKNNATIFIILIGAFCLNILFRNLYGNLLSAVGKIRINTVILPFLNN